MLGLDLKLPLPRMTYDEAMERFGHDAPDLRFGLELVDCTDLAATSRVPRVPATRPTPADASAASTPRAAATATRRKRHRRADRVRQADFGAKGLAWFKVEADGKLGSPIAKNFTDELLGEDRRADEGQAGRPAVVRRRHVGGDAARRCTTCASRFGEELKLYDPQAMHFSWIVEFPMFDYDEEEKRWAAMHHPFTAPRPQDLPTARQRPGQVPRRRPTTWSSTAAKPAAARSEFTTRQVQQQVFDLLGIDARAGHASGSASCSTPCNIGAPPHGGIALGIDRCVMLFGGLDNIRDCIAFPKTQKATDLMTDAPGTVDAKQLRELSLKTDAIKP